MSTQSLYKTYDFYFWYNSEKSVLNRKIELVETATVREALVFALKIFNEVIKWVFFEFFSLSVLSGDGVDRFVLLGNLTPMNRDHAVFDA